MAKYNHPNDSSVPLAPEPALPGNSRGGVRRLPIHEILARTSQNWRITRKKTLGCLTGTSGGSLDRFVDEAPDLGEIDQVGRLKKRRAIGIHEDLFLARTRVVGKDSALGSRSCIERLEEDDYTEGGRFFTSKNIVLKPHMVFVPEAAAWLVQGLHRAGIASVAYSEETLREEHGWFSPRKKPVGNANFCTEVPDALVLCNGMVLRVEFQNSDRGPTHYGMICAASFGDPVVYIVRRKAVYEALLKVPKETPNLFILRLWHEPDMEKFMRDILAFSFKHPNPRHRLFSHYSQSGFVYQAVSSPRAQAFFRQTELANLNLPVFFDTLAPAQQDEIREDLARKADEAWKFFYLKTKAGIQMEEKATKAADEHERAQKERDSYQESFREQLDMGSWEDPE